MNLIRESYRTRGKHLRINNKTTTRNRVISPTVPDKTTSVTILITINIPYSLKNRYTNISLPISMLNPLISSLSPSNRSNGARFVSIRARISQITAQAIISSNLIKVLIKLNLFTKMRKKRNTTIRETS